MTRLSRRHALGIPVMEALNAASDGKLGRLPSGGGI